MTASVVAGVTVVVMVAGLVLVGDLSLRAVDWAAARLNQWGEGDD